MKKSLSLILAISGVLFLAGCSTTEKVELPEVVQVKRVIPYHTVRDGDTVGTIATKYGMTRAELIKLNKLEPPYQLYDGQRLVVSPKLPEEIVESKQELKPTEEQTIDDIQKLQVAEVQEVLETEYVWPIENGKSKITQKFGSNDVDGGIVMKSSDGTPVKAIADGSVMIAGVPNGEAAAYGNTIVIKHTAKKTMSIYANLKEVKVKVGQKVSKGQMIGLVGKSGTIAKEPQLYFEINDLKGQGRKAVDPEVLLPK